MVICKFFESFNYCPKCGGEFIDNNDKSKKCKDCGFVYYFNPSAAVVGIIKNEAGELLTSTRANDPAKGMLDLPGGFVDCFESAEQSIAREIKEECNLEVISVKYLFTQPNVYRYSNFDVHTLDIFFECKIKSLQNITAADDVATLQFIPLDKIDVYKFGLSSIRKGLEKYLQLLLR